MLIPAQYVQFLKFYFHVFAIMYTLLASIQSMLFLCIPFCNEVLKCSIRKNVSSGNNRMNFPITAVLMQCFKTHVV